MAAKMAAAVAAAVAVTAVAAGDRRNRAVAAVAAVPERGVLRRGRERGHRGAGVDGCSRGSGERRAPNERESRARAALEHERVCAVWEIKEAAERAHARV